MVTLTLSQMLVVVLLAGIFAQVLSGIFRLPSILFLLSFGVLLGPDGFQIVQPKSLGRGLETLVKLAVALILFEGSMNLKVRSVLKVQRSVRMLITVGVLITLAGASAAAHFVGGLPFRFALLFGALVTVTGPTVIKPLLARIRVRKEIKSILASEGILADPIGAILAIVCLEFALAPEESAQGALLGYLQRLGIGAATGATVGFLLGFIVKHRARFVEALKPLVIMAGALGCYEVSEGFMRESGIMAVVAAGLAIQHGLRSYEQKVREFKEQLTTLLLSVLFILLSANLRLDAMRGEGWRGLLTVLCVMFLVRPLNIFLCTHRGEPTLREKIFLSWIAPRGIVAASVASLCALLLVRAGHPEGSRVEALVFLTIFLTVFAQGITAPLFAWMLRITATDLGQVLIVGANRLALALAEGLRKHGRQVALIDRNPYQVRAAQDAGFTCVEGDATERETLRQAGIEEVDAVLVLTGNSDVNQRVAYTAKHDYEIHRVWAALDSVDQKALDPLLARMGVEVLFGRPVPLRAWEADLSTGEARLDEVAAGKSDPFSGGAGETILPLYLSRSGHIHVWDEDTRPQGGDVVRVATRLPAKAEPPGAFA